MMLAIDLERHTHAIFVGEPTGSTPNHHGDSRKVRLPESGLTLRISTLYWQYSGPGDGRSAIGPHLPVVLSAADYRAGRDPVLDAILRPRAGAADPEGRWSGRTTISRNEIELALELERREDGWAVSVDLPRLGLDGAPVEEVRVDGADLRLVIPTPRFDLEFAGGFHADRIYALVTATGASRWYPVVLTRGP